MVTWAPGPPPSWRPGYHDSSPQHDNTSGFNTRHATQQHTVTLGFFQVVGTRLDRHPAATSLMGASGKIRPGGWSVS